MAYVITCGDEGVQINDGTRVAFAGAGVKLEGFSQAVEILENLLEGELRIAASAENAWTKAKFELDTWEQADATMQQHVEALADRKELLYAGFIPFADPEELKHDIKAHMVRPKGMHLANKIMFTLSGGEGTYNLGSYQISADWVGEADEELVKQVLEPQIEHYKEVAGKDLEYVLEEEGGKFSSEQIEKNKAMLEAVGIA